MLDTLLSGAFAPFSLSLALLFGLLALEVVFLLIGGSLMGDGAEADIDVPEMGDLGDLDVDLDAFDVDPGEFELELGEEIAAEAPAAASGTSPLAWLGLGKMPTLIWLGTIFLSFGVSGLVLQTLASNALGSPLPALIAAMPCGAVALWFTGRFGRLFARLLPKNETQSVSARQLGRRMGTITQGTAARGTPAEVRVTDRYGNTHYLRAEPMDDAAQIPQGTEVLVLRHRPTGGYRLIVL